tara:strand:+ start:15919 stop:16374 length:456 start_codon:yes stop_codon:yes gene_type:complete
VSESKFDLAAGNSWSRQEKGVKIKVSNESNKGVVISGFTLDDENRVIGLTFDYIEPKESEDIESLKELIGEIGIMAADIGKCKYLESIIERSISLLKSMREKEKPEPEEGCDRCGIVDRVSGCDRCGIVDRVSGCYWCSGNEGDYTEDSCL